MKALADEKIGKAIIRIVPQGGVYRGCIISGAKRGDILEDADLELLRARLRNEAGTLHPNYQGISGAIDRFLYFFPGGFADRAFDLDERRYKLEARRKLCEALPLDRAQEATSADAIAVRPAFNTNILSRFELARMHELLGSAEGAAFVRAAARFTQGDGEKALQAMVAAIAPHGRHSWPMLTYLPNLWLPDEHMFLKPNATVDFAQRVGHHFQHDYSAEPRMVVYESLLDLVSMTEESIASLGPQDRIDVQSFIWVVGDYQEKELARLQELRAQL